MPKNERTTAAPPASEESNAVTRSLPQSSALAQVDYGEDAGGGFEGVTQAELAIPLLVILQSNSPAVQDNLVEGARAGMIINSVTQELYESLRFVPCHRDHKFIEWTPRNEGGGLVAVHDPDSDVVKAARSASGTGFGKLKTPRTGTPGALNDLVETFSVFGIAVKDDDSYEYAFIPFSSTQIKHYKQWMTRARAIQVRGASGQRVNPPLWAHVYKLSTQSEKNAKGSWKGWNITFAGKSADEARLPQESELFNTAKAFRDLVMSGAAQANRESAQRFDTEGEGTNAPDTTGTNAF